MPEGLDVLAAVDETVPLTEDFVGRVRHGVRRRRMLRLTAAGGAAAAVLAVAVLVIAVAGPPPAPTLLPAVSAAASPGLLDGYSVGFVPDGLHAAGPDGFATYAVTRNKLHNDGPPPSPGAYAATVSSRRYARADGGSRLWITVLRPVPAMSPIDSPVPAWLIGAQKAGAEVTDVPDVPLGATTLLTHAGSEVTTHEILIVLSEESGIIVVTGDFPVPDLQKVATALSFAR